MSRDDDFVMFSDLQAVERMLTNAEIDYQVLKVDDASGYLIETDNIQFDFDSDENLLNVEPFKGDLLHRKTDRSMKGVC